MNRPRFVVYRDTAGDWRWRLVAANGRTVADSGEGYASRRGARQAITTVVCLVQDVGERVEGAQA